MNSYTRFHTETALYHCALSLITQVSDGANGDVICQGAAPSPHGAATVYGRRQRCNYCCYVAHIGWAKTTVCFIMCVAIE